MNEPIIVGGSEDKLVTQLGGMSNRHGLIAGATGTGKTVTLQVLAEGFSRLGVLNSLLLRLPLVVEFLAARYGDLDLDPVACQIHRERHTGEPLKRRLAKEAVDLTSIQ